MNENQEELQHPTSNNKQKYPQANLKTQTKPPQNPQTPKNLNPQSFMVCLMKRDSEIQGDTGTGEMIFWKQIILEWNNLKGWETRSESKGYAKVSFYAADY